MPTIPQRQCDPTIHSGIRYPQWSQHHHKNTERTPAKDDPSFDIMRPGGKNSPYDKDGKPKKKKPTGTKGGDKKGLRYNPYGSGTANPSNMAPGKP